MNPLKRQNQDRKDRAVKILDLSRRMRELTFLNDISDIIDRRGRPFGEMVEGVLSIIPEIAGSPERERLSMKRLAISTKRCAIRRYISSDFGRASSSHAGLRMPQGNQS